MSLQSRILDTEFQEWLSEECVWGGVSKIRWECIRMFILDGLYPFIEKSGYTWNCSLKDLQNRIATGLFNNRRKTHLQSEWSHLWPRLQVDCEDQRAHFHYILDESTWAKFWAEWGNWTDVRMDVPYGSDRRMDIEYYIWGELDLDNSAQTKILEAIMLGGEEESDEFPAIRSRAAAPDIYLQDAAESGTWGGYRR